MDMFTKDRDLLVLEPRLFIEISWSAQKLVDAASGASINSAGDTLTLAGVDFGAQGIGAGSVVLIGASPPLALEVIDRTSATMLAVSKLRPSAMGALIPAPVLTDQKLVIHTFRPQIELVHQQVLRSMGIEPGSDEESRIVNPRDFVLAEALGALHVIYSSASALLGSEAGMWMRARMYRERFIEERSRLVARLDLDQDGVAEVERRPNVLQLARG